MSTIESAAAEAATVLATSGPFESNRWTHNGRPRIIEFYGFEGEDLRYFLQLLESFFALSGIIQEYRKVAIMRAQLRRVALVYFENALKERDVALNKISFEEASQILQDRFISETTIECYQHAFDEMCQSVKESPSEFLSRLYEAADLANISDERFIYARYRAGLLQDIKTFCKEMSATNMKDWIKHSNAWWNAHSPNVIHLVENPFSAAINTPGYLNGENGKNLNSIRNDDKTVISRGVVGQNPKSAAEAYASAMSPSISAITAKMEALELHPLIPSTGEKGQADSDAIRDKTVKSLLSDDGFRSLLKSIVQEANDERVNARKPYKGKKQVYFDDENASNYDDRYRGNEPSNRQRYRYENTPSKYYGRNSRRDNPPQRYNYYNNGNDGAYDQRNQYQDNNGYNNRTPGFSYDTPSRQSDSNNAQVNGYNQRSNQNYQGNGYYNNAPTGNGPYHENPYYNDRNAMDNIQKNSAPNKSKN